jgi:nitrogenase molybdenum-cofactor synthesis protein NifE
MIAPALCAHNARLMLSHWEHSALEIENNLEFLLYEEDDIIHGASEKIHTAILDCISRNQPDVQFVVTSCLPEIVGEDIEAVLRQVRVKVSVPVLFIKTENFTDMTARMGQDNTIAALRNMMEKPLQRIPRSVNIIGANAKDFPGTELCRVLNNAGFSVNSVFPSRCDLNVIRDAPKAEFNILMNRNSGLLAERMKIDFDIPYIRFEQVYTPDSLRENYHNLGEFLDVDLVSLIQPDCDKLVAAIETSAERLGNASGIVSLSNGRVFDLAHFLILAGLHVKVVAVNDLTDQDFTDASRLQTLAPHILVTRNISWYPLDECIASLRPDYFLAFSGPDAVYCARYGVNHRNIPLRPHKNGFEAAVRILETLSMKKPGYSTLVLREQTKMKEEFL